VFNNLGQVKANWHIHSKFIRRRRISCFLLCWWLII